MDNTWIKTYRRIREHDLIGDPIAFTLFSLILVSVDRKTGDWKTTGIILAGFLKQKPTTVYKALMRLKEKYQVISISSNNKVTTIKVMN